MHKLTVIGWLGVKRAYLDVSREEAIKRYEVNEGHTPDDTMIKQFVFSDEFGVYDAYSVAGE